MIRNIPDAITDSDEADVVPCKLDDFIKRNIEIGMTILTSPSLFCVAPHAGFGHVQRLDAHRVFS